MERALREEEGKPQGDVMEAKEDWFSGSDSVSSPVDTSYETRAEKKYIELASRTVSLRDRGQSTTGAEAKLQGLKESLGGKGKKMVRVGDSF